MDVLHNYGIEKKDGREGVPAEQLTEPETIAQIVSRYASVSDIRLESTAASLIIKRYAVLTAAAALEYYGLQKQKDNWLHHAEFDFDRFALLVDDQHPELVGDWKTTVFAHHLTPMVEQFSKTCRIPQKILWENIAVRLQSVFRKKSTHYPHSQLQDLFDEMTEVDAEWSGCKENPFTKYLQRPEDWQTIPVRETCCRLYQLKEGQEQPYCGNCPLS
ncbi:IucA/IucC family C-terminal-domain containing protein [Jeotgalibacillus sp. ET6]|uniref:IucA/IucC family C-terminal-domain containing protein n=1 Tax=Jeotgalibacillus sp. ET6 TaxID=3037260 RepID=UPI0024183ECE|nr:IucA/IucC family C-terminal-domain containing protein [Jeotgalibacillus sp. ET6]MDG5472493.1 IucA/IucC family C-terminal-domain containing protein [Jeotgalibacillus sp. ET6]